MNEAQYEKARDEWIRSYVVEALGENGKYYPFSHENFSEAMQNLHYRTTDALASMAADIQPIGHYSLEIFGRAFYCDIYEYWENIAKKEAEERCPKREEMVEVG